VIASALGVFVGPLIAFIGLAIKLDSSGPVFCRQPRIGLIGRRFFVFKFRTVMHDPERASSGLRWDWHAHETRVGRFLSYTRMEDLPQLINVLRGEMTLIGAGGKPHVFDS
jgi:lipopolysaccharide/colanic/teichoic acid biosynthesis glycosyltransferase